MVDPPMALRLSGTLLSIKYVKIKTTTKKVFYPGLPHGQEKSGNQEKSWKTKKNNKRQVKIGCFWKKS